MQTRALGAPPADRSRSQALREAIGQYDPEGDGASPLVLAQDSSQGDPPAPPRTADSGREDLAQRRAPIEAAPGDVIGARSFRAVLPDLAGQLPVEGPVEAGDVVVNDGQ